MIDKVLISEIKAFKL